jgi:hypothetical protein
LFGGRVEGDVTRRLHGVALIVLTAAAAACGGAGTATTKLTIEVSDDSGVRSYRLECEPAGGTARNAPAMCKALRRQPDMRARARYITCGPGADPRAVEMIRVTGSYRGTPVHSSFQGVCVADNDGYGEWSDLLYDAGPGSPQSR